MDLSQCLADDHGASDGDIEGAISGDHRNEEAGVDGLMNLAEGFLTHIVKRVLEQHRADLTVIGRNIEKLEAVRK